MRQIRINELKTFLERKIIEEKDEGLAVGVDEYRLFRNTSLFLQPISGDDVTTFQLLSSGRSLQRQSRKNLTGPSSVAQRY